MMFFTPGSSLAPCCTAWATILLNTLDVAHARHRPDLGNQRLADASILALGRVAELDVEGHIGAVDAQVLDPAGRNVIPCRCWDRRTAGRLSRTLCSVGSWCRWPIAAKETWFLKPEVAAGKTRVIYSSLPEFPP